jgi:hypothetical protein
MKCIKCNKPAPEVDFRIRKGKVLKTCKDCEKARYREYYEANKEKVRKRKREWMAKKRAQDPDAARKYHREYHRNNRDERNAKMREYSGRRFFWTKAMKLRGEDRATTAEIASIWRKQMGRCALTGVRLDRTAQLDHILPKARGGDDTAENLQWLAADVNLAKKEKTDEEFIEMCRSVMAWIGQRIAGLHNIS